MRFRILNGSNARIYKLALSNSDPLIQSLPMASSVRQLRVIDHRWAGRTDRSGDRFRKLRARHRLILKNLDTSGSPLIPDVMLRCRPRRDRHELNPGSFSPELPLVEKFAGVQASLQQLSRRGALFGRSTGSTINRVDGTQPNATGGRSRIIPQAHPMHIHDIQWQIWT
jgi:hypothetical protein